MSARRDRDLQVNLEQIVHQLTVDVAAKLNTSASSYIRMLIVNDLRMRGLLTDGMLADMVAV